jgi:hypothetical protein
MRTNSKDPVQKQQIKDVLFIGIATCSPIEQPFPYCVHGHGAVGLYGKEAVQNFTQDKDLDL